MYNITNEKAYRNEINVIIVAACIPTLQPLLSNFETTRRTKGYRRSGSCEERIELTNLPRVYSVKRNGTTSLPRHTQPRNHNSIQSAIDVDVCLGAV